MGNSKLRIGKLLISTFVFTGVLVWVLTCTDVLAWYKAKYTESAHGSSSVGVKRKSGTSTADYAAGNCAHCHEQHASIGGNSHTAYAFGLFAPNDPTSQTDNFCFQCHKGVGSVQDRVGGITNYTYSKNFGGGTETFTTIYDALNPSSGPTPSSHNLSDIQNHALGTVAGFTSDTNGCIACHDPHTAQKNYDPVVVNPTLGGVNTAIRRPIDYDNRRPNLWGDEDAATSGYNERMVDFTSRYQAPFFKDGSPNQYEPANNGTSDGSNLPNFRLFCLGPCHGRSDVYSTERSRNLYEIDWTTDGDKHGRAHEDGSSGGVTIAPYDDPSYNYVLSCTDCHEPHGSENEWLLRTCVNGKDNITVPGPGQWLDFCTACHSLNQHTSPWSPTTDCYNNGICHYHGHGVHF